MLEVDSEFVRRKVAQYVWDQVEKKKDDNIRAIGFGVGIREGEIDIERPFCVRAYVKKKKTRRSNWKPKYEFRESLKFPLEYLPHNLDNYGRRIRKASITIPTDVCHAPELEGTARFAFLDRDPSAVTTGVVVRFRMSHQRRPRWGLLTVAHGYDRPIGGQANEDISVVSPATGAVFRGKRLAEFRAPSSGIDLCLVVVAPQLLIQSGLISSINTSSIPVRTYEELNSDRGKSGTVFQTDRRRFDFSIWGTVEIESFAGVGQVVNLLHVQSSPNVFVEGSSGSPFGVVNLQKGRMEAAALQIGSNPATGYREGYGQSLETSLRALSMRINRRLSRTGRYIAEPIEVVRIF